MRKSEFQLKQKIKYHLKGKYLIFAVLVTFSQNSHIFFLIKTLILPEKFWHTVLDEAHSLYQVL